MNIGFEDFVPESTGCSPMIPDLAELRPRSGLVHLLRGCSSGRSGADLPSAFRGRASRASFSASFRSNIKQMRDESPIDVVRRANAWLNETLVEVVNVETLAMNGGHSVDGVRWRYDATPLSQVTPVIRVWYRLPQ